MKDKNEWVEVLVFIHGMTPSTKPGPHTSTYKQLKDPLLDKLDGFNPGDNRVIDIEWGWQVN